MHPVLFTAPESVPVSLEDIKLWCRVAEYDSEGAMLDGDEDALLQSLVAAAVDYLDGWRGVLGRAIIEQVWLVSIDYAGDWLLPMPDVTSATVDYGDGPEAITVTETAAGPRVTVTGECTIAMTCAMSATMRGRAALVIKMLAAHWFENREAVGVNGTPSEIPLTASAIIETLRWRRVG